MSFKAKISNSKDYNYSTSPHIYSYKYMWINHFIHFILNAFIKKTMYPFISIGLFIVVIILNSVQYSNNEYYLQNQLTKFPPSHTLPNDPESLKNYKDKNITTPQNALLYFYDLIGINGFTENGLAHILFYILTYICLGLVEMNIGHTKTVFFLLILLMFGFFSGGFSSAICENYLYDAGSVENTPYCCGSFILFATLGFTLFIMQKHVSDLYTKMVVWFIIACVWGSCVLYENYLTYGDEKPSDKKTCKIFFHHAFNYILGIFCALVLSN